MGYVGQLKPGLARVHDAGDSGAQGAKEYVPVNAEHARAIVEGMGSAEAGVPEPHLFAADKVRVRFNCSYDVMDASGSVRVVRAGHERLFDPKKEGMADRACEGIRYRKPTFEQEVIAMSSQGGGKLYPTFEGWGTFSASKLRPEYPRSYGVQVRPKP